MMTDRQMEELWERLEGVRESLKDESFNEGRIELDSEPTVLNAVDACTTCGRGVARFDQEGQGTSGMWIAEDGMEAEGDRRSKACAVVLETRAVLEMLKATGLKRGDKVRCGLGLCRGDCVHPEGILTQHLSMCHCRKDLRKVRFPMLTPSLACSTMATAYLACWALCSWWR